MIWLKKSPFILKILFLLNKVFEYSNQENKFSKPVVLYMGHNVLKLNGISNDM
jgi:hypothetical protein